MLTLYFSRREPVTEDDIDHEEEFYYTEIEVPLSASLSDLTTPPSPSSPTNNLNLNATTNTGLNNVNCQFIANSAHVSSLISNGTNGSNSPIRLPLSFPKTNSIFNGVPVLSDHMDMARPPHENPEYVHHTQIISRPITQTQQQQSSLQQQPTRRLIASSATGGAINAGQSGTIIIPQSHLQQQQQSQQQLQQQQQQSMFQRVQQPIAATPANALPIAIPVTSFAFTATNATVRIDRQRHIITYNISMIEMVFPNM